MGLTGCPTDAGDGGGGNSLTIKVKNAKNEAYDPQADFFDGRLSKDLKTVNFDPALALAAGATSSESWEITGLNKGPDGKVACLVIAYSTDSDGSEIARGNSGLLDPGSSYTIELR
ncbi:MAG: hypothetical protein LBD48_06600 [Treponema sp.]|nr:hypothetical protein [Treponema sp.]